MTYTGPEFEKTETSDILQNYNPVINNHPSILTQMSRFQLLYEELNSVTQLVFIVDKDKSIQELEQVRNVKKRFKDAAEEAHDIVDLFISAIMFENKRVPAARSYVFERSLINLEDVMSAIECIKVEFTTISNKMNMDSSPRTNPQFAGGTSCTRNPVRRKNAVMEEIVVGLDHGVVLIRDKLVEDQKKLEVLKIDEQNDFESLTFLEKLKWIISDSQIRTTSGELVYQIGGFRKIHTRLPASLKILTLVGCRLPWSDMSPLQLLPTLEVLKILDDAFEGPLWEAGKEQFQHLKFLKLRGLNIQQWEACSLNFPCLKRLVLERCKDLEEIPLELGDIPTLELIRVDDSEFSCRIRLQYSSRSTKQRKL